jgi:hypothetical protein
MIKLLKIKKIFFLFSRFFTNRSRKTPRSPAILCGKQLTEIVIECIVVVATTTDKHQQ